MYVITVIIIVIIIKCHARDREVAGLTVGVPVGVLD